MPVPTLGEAKLPLAAAQLTLPTSPEKTPLNVQFVIFAIVVPSYVLLPAVTEGVIKRTGTARVMRDRKVIHTGNMTIARIRLQKQALVPEHSHVHEQVSMVEKGALKFIIDGGEQIVRAGEALAIAPHVKHSVEALEDSQVTDVFSPSRDDWRSGNDQYLRR